MGAKLIVMAFAAACFFAGLWGVWLEGRYGSECWQALPMVASTAILCFGFSALFWMATLMDPPDK